MPRRADGVEIPVSLVYRKDKREPGTNPLYVYGYGSYGYSLPVGFSANRLSLLDRGLVHGLRAYPRRRRHGQALARCRARADAKRNTFTDFIAASSI